MNIQRLTCILVATLFLAACGGPSVPPELQRGVQMIRTMTAPMYLSRSMYSAIQDGKASTWVSFFFSGMGAAERPDTEEAAERDPMLAEQAKAGGLPLVPKGVEFVANAPNRSKGRQIVLKADDARGVVIVEAYESPVGKPLLTEEILLKPVKPALGVAEMARSAMEMGMSPKMGR